MSSTARLFIAAIIPESVLDRIAEFQQPLKKISSDIKWVRPENIHITLKFLGDTPLVQVDDIVDVMKTSVARVRPFEVIIREAGAFPNLSCPRVLWLGVQDGGWLIKMAASLNHGLAAFGIETEHRGFQAHLTLGRVKSQRNTERVTRQLSQPSFQSDAFVVNAIHLIKSELKPGGAVYTSLRTVQIKG